MRLHPELVKIIQSLDREGRAGARPWGIPLAIWRDAYPKA